MYDMYLLVLLTAYFPIFPLQWVPLTILTAETWWRICTFSNTSARKFIINNIIQLTFRPRTPHVPMTINWSCCVRDITHKECMIDTLHGVITKMYTYVRNFETKKFWQHAGISGLPACRKNRLFEKTCNYPTDKMWQFGEKIIEKYPFLHDLRLF